MWPEPSVLYIRTLLPGRTHYSGHHAAFWVFRIPHYECSDLEQLPGWLGSPGQGLWCSSPDRSHAGRPSASRWAACLVMGSEKAMLTCSLAFPGSLRAPDLDTCTKARIKSFIASLHCPGVRTDRRVQHTPLTVNASEVGFLDRILCNVTNAEHIQKIFFRSLSLLLLGGPCTRVFYVVGCFQCWFLASCVSLPRPEEDIVAYYSGQVCPISGCDFRWLPNLYSV